MVSTGRQEVLRYFSKKRPHGRDCHQPSAEGDSPKNKELTLQSAAKAARLDNLLATLMVLIEKVLSSSDESSVQSCRADRDTTRDDNALNCDSFDNIIHDVSSNINISQDDLHRITSSELLNDLLKSRRSTSHDDINQNYGSEQAACQESCPHATETQVHLGSETKDDVEIFWRRFPCGRPQGLEGRKSCLKRTRKNSVARKTHVDETPRTKIRNFLKRTQRSVQFGDVEVRQYGIELGDNPSCGSGPAIALSWEFATKKRKSLALYEVTRAPRRYRDELRLSDREREEMLLENGFTLHEQSVAIESSARDKIRRMKTVLNFKYSKYEEKLECARDMIMRLLHLRKNDEEMMEALWEAAYLEEHDEVRAAALRQFRSQRHTFHSRCA